MVSYLLIFFIYFKIPMDTRIFCSASRVSSFAFH